MKPNFMKNEVKLNYNKYQLKTLYIPYALSI